MRRRSLISSVLAGGIGLVSASKAAEPAKSTEREMNRKDRALTPEECEYILNHVKHAVLGTADNSGTPYAVPVSPIYLNGKIYFHGNGQKGRKLVNMEQNPNVSMCYIAMQENDEPDFNVHFASVIVAGKARRIDDKEEKRKFMREINRLQSPSMSYEASEHHINRPFKLDVISIWEITPEKISGKGRHKNMYFKKEKAK